MKHMVKKLMISVLICLFPMAWGNAAQKATPEDAKKMVEQAIAYVKANGQEKALKELNNPNSLLKNSIFCRFWFPFSKTSGILPEI